MILARRKSVMPMAGSQRINGTAAQHHPLCFYRPRERLSDENVLAKVRELVHAGVGTPRAVEAWIIDAHELQERHTRRVGSTILRRSLQQDTCQVAVKLSIANHYRACRWPIVCICPKEWRAIARRRKVGVPERSVFKLARESLCTLRWGRARPG